MLRELRLAGQAMVDLRDNALTKKISLGTNMRLHQHLGQQPAKVLTGGQAIRLSGIP